jgi:hypothetical protein
MLLLLHVGGGARARLCRLGMMMAAWAHRRVDHDSRPPCTIVAEWH